MVNFNKPDVKATRVHKSKFNIDTQALYFNLQENPKMLGINYEAFKLILKGFAEHVRETICKERYGVELPGDLGYVYIATVKIKGEVIDMAKSIEIGEKVLAKNWDTDGMSSKIYYTNFDMKYRFANREIWGFNGNRDLTREVSKAFKSDWKKYQYIKDLRAIKDVYKQTTMIESVPFIEEDYNYNEFDI